MLKGRLDKALCIHLALNPFLAEAPLDAEVSRLSQPDPPILLWPGTAMKSALLIAVKGRAWGHKSSKAPGRGGDWNFDVINRQREVRAVSFGHCPAHSACLIFSLCCASRMCNLSFLRVVAVSFCSFTMEQGSVVQQLRFSLVLFD